MLSKGSNSPTILIVGSQPGKGAEVSRIPFVGDQAGSILFPALQFIARYCELNISEDPSELQLVEALGIRLSEAVKCRVSDDPDEEPKDAERNHCSRFLQSEITAHQNTLNHVICFGEVARKAVNKALLELRAKHSDNSKVQIKSKGPSISPLEHLAKYKQRFVFLKEKRISIIETPHPSGRHHRLKTTNPIKMNETRLRWILGFVLGQQCGDE